MTIYRPILFVIGYLLIILSGFMIFPAIADFYVGNDDWEAFISSAFITCFIGGVLIFSNKGDVRHFTVKQAFIMTTLSWVAMAFFSALPFMFSGLEMSFTDSFFESMSGFTTTGSSVMSGLDHAPPGILLWRALMQALGGVGIIVFAMAILPMLRIGGMQLFRTESSDRSDKILPRATQISGMIGITYIVLTSLCFLCLWLSGMTAFDALCHSFATISTGGYSTHDASVGFYNGNHGVIIFTTIFMICGALPFTLYAQLMHGSYKPLLRDTQVRWFLTMILVLSASVAVWDYKTNDRPLLEAVEHSLFNVVSVITTTGFATADYSQWGSFVVTLIFIVTVIGGCTGSTTGGIKVFRFQVLYETAKAQIARLIQPHGVFTTKFNGKPISEAVTNSVMSFFILYAFSFTVAAVILSLTGLDYLTSMSAAATAISNTGPGLGNIVGPVGNFSSLTDAAKWVLSFTMLLGRLEIFTVLVLLSPYFWRD